MVQTLEAIKGGGGSIKVGTTGKIGTLMLRELESVLQTPMSHRNTSPTESALIVGSASPKAPKSRALVDEASSSGTSKINKQVTPEIVQKGKHHRRSSNQVPMLESDNISIDGTPIRHG